MPHRISDIELHLFLEAVYLRYHYDFRAYVGASLKRRLRAAMLHFDCATLTQLQDRVLHDEGIITPLLDYMTVQVTEMFRDPGYFRALREHVVPMLHTYPFIKIWVAGCSTGEEAWSMAILLDEEGLLERTQIYATDINIHALQTAQAGVYPLDQIGIYTANHRAAGGKTSLSDHYTAAYGHAQFHERLRRHVVFSDHSLATDNVFAEMQLISCRNVLIYFNRGLQDRAVGLFREALCAGGYLGLGARESLAFTQHTAAFSEVSALERLYQKVTA
ncbi:MAG: protein-glutamate O-methyltransferase CheR [Comamonas sp.]